MDIIPSIGVGRYRLGMAIDEIKELLRGNYVEKSLHCHIVLETDDMKFWFEKEWLFLTQIMMFGKASGVFMNFLSIGSKLKDIDSHDLKWAKGQYVYYINDYPGLSFELTETEDWDEEDATIEYISVFNPMRVSIG